MRVYPRMGHYDRWLNEPPTQVAFRDDVDNAICGGILFDGKIICGCCGGAFPVEEVEWFEPLNWNNISDTIIEGGWE